MIKLYFFVTMFFFMNSACIVKGKYEEIPDFDWIMLDSSTVFKTSNIPEGTPFVIMYFDPECSLCQDETKDWLGKMGQMQDIRFFFLTNDSFEKMRLFGEVFKIKNYSNIMLLNDKNDVFRKAYNPSMIPYVVLYNGKRQAQHIYAGGLSGDRLISMIIGFKNVKM